MERVEWISIMHKQNLNGRETEDELFEAGILAGIEETEAIMYSEEDMEKTFNAGSAFAIGSHRDFKQTHPDFTVWLEQLKKK